jgi:hypothetical protein
MPGEYYTSTLGFTTLCRKEDSNEGYYSGHYLLNIQQMDWNEESRWVRA